MPDRVLDVTDPVALRALAHPLRLRLLRLLRDRPGPATGAELAAATGESTASVSYHLSVLRQHGFVEPDPTPGPTRRHKPWRTTYETLRVTTEGTGLSPLDSPGGPALAVWLADTRGDQDAYLSRPVRDEVEDSATFAMTRLRLDAASAQRLAAEVSQVLDGYRSDGDPQPGEQAFSVSFVVVPVGEER
jgi:DNA-binding transcriptional ArsR family regulator